MEQLVGISGAAAVVGGRRLGVGVRLPKSRKSPRGQSPASLCPGGHSDRTDGPPARRTDGTWIGAEAHLVTGPALAGTVLVVTLARFLVAILARKCQSPAAQV